MLGIASHLNGACACWHPFQEASSGPCSFTLRLQRTGTTQAAISAGGYQVAAEVDCPNVLPYAETDQYSRGVSNSQRFEIRTRD